jgi:hypothetical protein
MKLLQWQFAGKGDFPWRPDLIICAHSFQNVPPWAVEWARLGAIRYHPLLW